MRLFILLFAFVCTTQSLAYNDKKCFSMYTKNALRKYDYKYLGPISVTSDTTTKEGSTKVTTQNSTQSSTMAVDPTVSAKRWLSSTQYSSSWGECALFGYHQQEQERQIYVAYNTADIKQDMAVGKGPHLKAIAQLSGCNSSAFDRFGKVMRQNFASFKNLQNDSYTFSQRLNNVITDDKMLAQSCLHYAN